MKLLLVDDQQLVRDALRALLDTVLDGRILEAANGQEALDCLQRELPDLVLLDLMLPDIRGPELLRQMLSSVQTVRVVVLSMYADPWLVARAMEFGAIGYLSKNASVDELLMSVHHALEGRRYIEKEIAQKIALDPLPPISALTELEVQAMYLVAEGATCAEVADRLGVDRRRASRICRDAKAKLGLTNLFDLMRFVALTDPGFATRPPHRAPDAEHDSRYFRIRIIDADGRAVRHGSTALSHVQARTEAEALGYARALFGDGVTVEAWDDQP
jgi:DNA-binding NarL/FixJ family response regulator